MESPEPPDEPMGSPGGASSPSKDDAPVDFDAGKHDEEKVVHVVQLPSKDVHQEVAQPENEDLFPDDMELREAEATYLDRPSLMPRVVGRGLARFRAGVRKYILAHRASQQFIPLEYREQRERQKSRERGGATYVDMPGSRRVEQLVMVEDKGKKKRGRLGRKAQPGIHTPETPPQTGDHDDRDGKSRGESRGTSRGGSKKGRRGGPLSLLEIVKLDPGLRREEDLRVLVNKLLSHSYFSEKGHEVVTELARHMRLLTYRLGDMIFKPKDGRQNSGAFYVLVSGTVSVEVAYEKIIFDVCKYTTGETFNRAPSHKTAARCVTDCKLMVVTVRDVENATRHIEDKKMSEKIHFFRQLPHFHDLHLEDLRKALLPFEQKDHTANQVISCQGEKKHFDKLFVVITGECRIVKKLILPAAAKGGDVASRRRATSFLEDARKKKAPPQPAPPAGAPRRGRRESLGGRRGSLSGRHNSINTVAEFYDLGRLQAGDFFGDCSSLAVGGGKTKSLWNEGPDYSVIALCYTRVYVAPVAALVRDGNPATRACFGHIRAHLERVSAAFEHHTILSLHQKSVAWERYKRRVVKDQVAPHFVSCGRSYGTGKIPTEGEVDDAPVDRPKALNLRQAPGDEEEEDGKQDGISNEIRQIFGARVPQGSSSAAKQNSSRLTIM